MALIWLWITVILVFIWSTIPPVDMWIIPQPKVNIWKVLTKVLDQDLLCLTTVSAADLLSTCLVGIPSNLDEFPPPLNSSLKLLAH